MKRRSLACLLTLLLLIAIPAYAGAQQEGATTAKTSKKTINVSGIVGSGGKFLVSEKGNRIWKVLNPDLLTAIEGRRVTVKARANVDASEITITLVRLLEQRTSAKLDDVAFRR